MLHYTNYLKFLKSYLLLSVPGFINKIVMEKNQLFIYSSPIFLRELLLFLRDNSNCLFKVLIDIVGIDFIERENRFEICYTLLSIHYNCRIIIKINVDEIISVPSITCLYQNANWFEREVWDMFGILFRYHPDLRRILTDYGFKGYPLRKDFPLSGYVEVIYDSITEQVTYKPVKLIQEFRILNYKTPWGYSLDKSKVKNNKIKLIDYRSILKSSHLIYYK